MKDQHAQLISDIADALNDMRLDGEDIPTVVYTITRDPAWVNDYLRYTPAAIAKLAIAYAHMHMPGEDNG